MLKKVLILASVIEGPQIKLIKKSRSLSLGNPAEKKKIYIQKHTHKV